VFDLLIQLDELTELIEVIAECVMRQVNRLSPRPLGANPQKKKRKVGFHGGESCLLPQFFFGFFRVENRPLKYLL